MKHCGTNFMAHKTIGLLEEHQSKTSSVDCDSCCFLNYLESNAPSHMMELSCLPNSVGFTEPKVKKRRKHVSIPFILKEKDSITNPHDITIPSFKKKIFSFGFFL